MLVELVELVVFNLYELAQAMHLVGEVQLVQPGEHIGAQAPNTLMKYPGWHIVQLVGLEQFVQFGEQTGMQEVGTLATVVLSLYPGVQFRHLVGLLQFAQFIEQFGEQPPVIFMKY